MVPLWFIRRHYDGFRIVRTGLSGLPLADHYRFGMMLKEAAEAENRKVVIVASGDLSHKLQTYGPYGFAPEGPEYDKRIMDVCGRGAFGELLDFDETFCEKAAECGHRSFVIMAGAFDGMAVEAKALSHQDVTGVGYGICTFYPKGEDEERHFLDRYLKRKETKLAEQAEKADPYVKLARQSLEAYIRNGTFIQVPDGLPEEMLKTRAGAFVSIHKHGKLRGCIGTISPTAENVAQEIIRNAVSASTRDPRFDPISEDELKWLEINVDVLGKPEKIDSTADLDVKRYGVIVSCGYKRGLLLPDLDGVDTPQQQIAIAMQKGGIRESDPYTLERFEVVRHT
jgi:AmmeMemoRadiSam system protein A